LIEPAFHGLLEAFDFAARRGMVRSRVLLHDAEPAEFGLEAVADDDLRERARSQSFEPIEKPLNAKCVIGWARADDKRWSCYLEEPGFRRRLAGEGLVVMPSRR
jgi:hypothetical protein